MNNIPIIFIHKGNDLYLKSVLLQAKAYNPEATIYLLGDQSNDIFDFVVHENIDNYLGQSKKFEKIYKHRSSNSVDFELFCFNRWFVIFEFAKKKNLKHFLCLDSDELLFCNINEIFSAYLDYDYTICNGLVPNVTLFNIKSLERFCNFIVMLYQNSTEIEKLDKIYDENFIKTGREGGICDMTAFIFFAKEENVKVKELTDIENHRSFDNNINKSCGYTQTLIRKKKKIYWENNLPYGKIVDTGEKVQFLALHLQGIAKLDIFSYTVDENKRRSYFLRFKKEFFKTYLKVRYYRYRVDMIRLKRRILS